MTATHGHDAEQHDQELFRAVFFDAADAMLVLDDGRTIVEANPAACALFGSAIVNRSLDALLAGNDQLDATWRELLAFGEAKREHRVQSHTSGTRVVECSYRARLHDDRHLCIARDITERRLLQQRLAQAEKLESVGRLAGGIAHDFNNLLTAILGYTELLLGERGPDHPERGDLEEIQRAGMRAAALTQQLLAFSRKQVLMPKEVDLNGAVSGLRTIVARLIRDDISLTCERSATPAIVRIDPRQFEQALLNLVLNARDALPAGGRIRIEVACVPASEAQLPADFHPTAASYVRVRVIDDGIGIPPEVREHIFEPFYTTKDVGQGRGLGLASVYGIVHQSDGVITVDSQPGAGSTFTMHFPAAGRSDDGSRAARRPAEISGDQATILLVEDEDAVRAIVSAILRRHGYHVLEAATPVAACELFERHANDIDLLLTDVVMPEMNGRALAHRLIGDRPDLRVLFISGYADNSDIRMEPASPNVSFLSKPFQASALVNRVKGLLMQRPVI
jgi:two-component system, cell cycle sensor histidine kinase and response regulator CckA